MTPLFELRDVKKYYGPMLALHISHLVIMKGGALVLEGPNGSGKSTLLRLLAFLEEPTAGTVSFFGGPEPRKECTMLLQEPWLLHETVFHNVCLGLKLRGIHKNLAEKYEQAMLQAGFANPSAYARRKPHALSGGEKQRVALASRLVLNPSCLLLDEPTAYVDTASSIHITQALLNAHKNGMTIVCATHDRKLSQSLAAPIKVMEKPE